MAPATTGNRLGDHVLQIELADCAWNLAQQILKPNGSFVAKVFDGEKNAFCARVKSGAVNKALKTRGDTTTIQRVFLNWTGI